MNTDVDLRSTCDWFYGLTLDFGSLVFSCRFYGINTNLVENLFAFRVSIVAVVWMGANALGIPRHLVPFTATGDLGIPGCLSNQFTLLFAVEF